MLNVLNTTEGRRFALTEHGHVLPGVQVPVAPVGPVAMKGCVLLMIVGWFCPKSVDNSNMTSVMEQNNVTVNKIIVL